MDEIFHNFRGENSNKIEVEANLDETDEVKSDDDDLECEDEDGTFDFLTIDQIIETIKKDIDDVKSIVSMPDSNIRILLNRIKWNKNELVNQLTGENRDEFIANVNITNPLINDKDTDSGTQKWQNNRCVLCKMGITQGDSVRLGCDHEYCTSCYCFYVTTEITKKNATESIYCSVRDCDKIIDGDAIMQVITPDVRQKYQQLMANSFVKNNNQLFRWCSAPNCNLAIQAKSFGNNQNCTCECGQSFCFNCGNECHDPIPCEWMSKWKNDLYFNHMTKWCPGCNALIEKDAGYNQVVCTICAYEFCWKCCREWEPSVKHLECSIKIIENYKRRDPLELYEFNEMRLERESCLVNSERINDQIKKLINNDVSICEAQFLSRAVKILCESRKQLMFSSIFAYFVPPYDQKEIFEMNQKNLQSDTEKLSKYFEMDLEQKKREENENTIFSAFEEMKFYASHCEFSQNGLKRQIVYGAQKE